MVRKFVGHLTVELKSHTVHLERKFVELTSSEICICRRRKFEVDMRLDLSDLVAVILNGIPALDDALHHCRKIRVRSKSVLLSRSHEWEQYCDCQYKSFHTR